MVLLNLRVIFGAGGLILLFESIVGRSSILSMTILFEVSSETKEPISGSCLKKYFVFKS